MKKRKIFLTGGAGFIGSHLAETLVKAGNEVIVFDNLSSGKKEFLLPIAKRKNFTFVKGDLLVDDFDEVLKECDAVFHLAANPDVRLGAEDTNVHLEQNLIATYRLLEAMRRTGAKNLLFTSTSTVYGEAAQMPTPETYGGTLPISLYGASKLGCEALIAAYCGTFGMKSVIYRFANVVGPHGTHGVIFDFIRKLTKNPKQLEILGDGTQTKSYCYISDCVDAMLHCFERQHDAVEIYNIGSEDWIDVKGLADIVVSEMRLRDVRYSFTGGGRGWKGDVKKMLLSIDKIKALGWTPRFTSGEAIRLTARALLEESGQKRA